MIDGINVIDTVQVRNISLASMIGMTILIFLIVMLLLFLIFDSVFNQSAVCTVIWGLFLIVIGVFTFLFWENWIDVGKNYHTEYKVILEDNLKYNEFNEKYEILHQDGKIYTIKEMN